MNPTHIHLLLNHFPIIGTMIGSIILLIGLAKKNHPVIHTALLILTVMAIVAIPVYLTGEPAEENVEKLPGISEALIEEHESAAAFAIWLMELTGLVAFICWIGQRKHIQWLSKLSWITALFSLMASAAMARTGYLGGQIRHTEISNSGASAPNGHSKGDAGMEKNDDD